MQKLKPLQSSKDRRHLIFLLIGIGVFLRFFVTTLQEPNFDFESFTIVADIMSHGGNVYAETGRYNYGPVWFFVLHVINQIIVSLPENTISFRQMLVAFLTTIDVGIFVILRKMYGVAIAALFLFNPISIITTGVHHQFDNFALLLGLCSVLLIGDTMEGRLTGRKIAGLGMLGLSLMTKHLLFLFPLWLAIKQKGLRKKMVVFFLPVFLFTASFLPYWRTGSSGILQNVFFYRSFDNAPLWNFFLPQFVSDHVSEKMLFFGMLIALGFLFRKKTVYESFWLYTASFVIFSSAVANQYFAIVVPFVSIYLNWGLLAFVFVETIRLLPSFAGAYVPIVNSIVLGYQGVYYMPSILLLFVGFLWVLRDDIHNAVRKRMN